MSEHLAPDQLEPDVLEQLTPAERAHLRVCLQCRLKSDELRSLDGAPPSTDPDPERVGPYLLRRKLGQGGMGVVWRAEHEQTGELVALKRVKAPQPSVVDSLRREIRALAQLSHPGVVRIVADGVEHGVPWYAMELVEGQQLSLEMGPTRLLQLLREVCGTLAFLHGHGLVHRDLKPENILVRPDGRAVLVDFGLSSASQGLLARESLERTALGAGSALTISPEAIRGEPIDARADLYAMGCLLYLALTGQPPFWAQPASAILDKHLHERPVPPRARVPSVSPELDALVMQLLEKHPRDRLGYAVDVARRLGEQEIPDALLYLYRPSLVGRARALGQLQELAQTPLAPARLVLLTGESGIGKTRLASELGRHAQRQGKRVIVGECLPGDPRPLGALAGWLRAVGDQGADDLLGANGPWLWPYAPFLAELPGQSQRSPPEPMPVAQAHRRLYRALTEVMLAYTAERPLVLLLDDLQWADELTLQWIHAVLTLPEPPRWLFVGTCRSEEGQAQMAPLRALPGTVELPLPRLEQEEVGGLVSEMLAWPEPPDELVATLHSHSEGNPFFAAEYLRAAAEEGHLRRDAQGRWQLAVPLPQALPLPGQVSSLLKRRLDRLEPDARRLLDLGAVIGRTLSSSLLERLAPFEQILIEAQLWEPGEGSALRFTHDRIREVAYELLSDGQRAGAHREVAQAMQSLPEHERAPLLGQLGLHWHRAGDPVAARAAYLAGAHRARELGNLDEAAALYESYFALQPPPSRERAYASLAYGDGVLRPAGKPSQAEKILRSSLESDPFGPSVEDRQRQAHLWGAVGRCCTNLGRSQESYALASRALQLHQEAGDRMGEGACLNNLAKLDLQLGRLTEAQEKWTRALDIHREIGELKLEALSLLGLALLADQRGQAEEARALLEQALEQMRRAGARREEGHILGHLGSLYTRQGRYREGRDHLEQALAVHREVGNRKEEGWMLTSLASLLVRQGHSGLAYLEQALLLARETEDRANEADVLGQMALQHRDLGRSDEAIALTERSLALYQSLQQRRSEARTLGNLGILRMERGEMGAAEDAYTRALEIYREIGFASGQGITLNNLGSLRLEQGQPVEALALLQEGLALHRRTGTRKSEQVSLVALAQAHHLLKDLPRAIALYEQGLALALELDLPSYVAQARERLASLHLPSTERARVCLAPLAIELLSVEARGQVQGCLAELLALEGELEQASVQLAEAKPLLQRAGSRSTFGVLLCREARIALLRGDPIAHERALREAEALAQSIGAGLDSILGEELARTRQFSPGPSARDTQ